MNDLDLLVRETFDEVPEPTCGRLDAGRERLLASIANPSRTPASPWLGRAGHQWPRAVAVAAAAIAALVIGITSSDRHAPSSPQISVHAARIALAARVLRAAALTDASQPTRRPAADQWIYTTSVQRERGQATQGPYPAQWLRFDGRASAYRQNGRLVVHTNPTAPNTAGTPLARYATNTTPMNAYDALASLPPEPTAMLRAVDTAVKADPESVAPPGSSPSGRHNTRAQLEFQYLATLLWNASLAAPARAEAAVFRAMQTIPGVSAQSGITDAVGRPAVALSDTGDEQQLLLDPHTYQVTGLRTISDGSWPVNPTLHTGPAYPKGTVVSSIAWDALRLVRGPGERY